MDTTRPYPFRFQPLSNSWVALHPRPKGVVQFIGGAFFGTWPTVFYRYLLRFLYQQGYTIIALPFRFSFRHWSIAAALYAEQQALKPILIQEAERREFDPCIYSDLKNYAWLGHSMGCKYIALLECLSDTRWESLLKQALGQETAKRVIQQLKRYDSRQPIKIVDQRSVLLAPDISDTESAIPIKSFARLLDQFKLGVLPTRKQTQRLIEISDLFNLTGMISFDRDKIAGNFSQAQLRNDDNDVAWLLKILQTHMDPVLAKEIPGKHLEPMGLTWRQLTWNPFGLHRTKLSRRVIESNVNTFFDRLQSDLRDA